MPGPRIHRLRAVIVLLHLTACPILWSAAAAAQSASYFSPTYAASDGSPYSDVYARTFGAGGPPPEAQAPLTPPLVTAARPVVPLSAPLPPGSDVVYVIQDGRLLTFSAEDYARKSGAALAEAPLPRNRQAITAPELELPSIADRLYDAAPLETAAGAQGEAPGAPIRLVPPQN